MTAPDKPTPGQIGLVDGPYKVIRDWDGAPTTQPHLLTGPKFEMCYKDAIEAELEAERLNLVFEAGRFSVAGQGQEERDRKVFEAGYEAFCTKHYTLDQAWDDFAAADAAKKEGGK